MGQKREKDGLLVLYRRKTLEWGGWQFLSWTWSLVESCSLCREGGGERFTSYQPHFKSLRLHWTRRQGSCKPPGHWMEMGTKVLCWESWFSKEPFPCLNRMVNKGKA